MASKDTQPNILSSKDSFQPRKSRNNDKIDVFLDMVLLLPKMKQKKNGNEDFHQPWNDSRVIRTSEIPQGTAATGKLTATTENWRNLARRDEMGGKTLPRGRERSRSGGGGQTRVDGDF